MRALRTIDLGDGFEADYVDIFLGSINIEEYIVSRSNSDFYSDNGILYIDNDDLLMVFYPISKRSDEYLIPDNVAENMQLEHISVDERSNSYYVSNDGILKDKRTDIIVFYPASFMMGLEQ